VTVLVHVNFTARPRRSPQGANSQSNDHKRHAKLKPATYFLRNCNTQGQHDHAYDQERRSVSRTPERANERGTKDVLVPAHNRRYRHDVIDFCCVFQSKNQSDSQDGK
jgi:hypothetical protein